MKLKTILQINMYQLVEFGIINKILKRIFLKLFINNHRIFVNLLIENINLIINSSLILHLNQEIYMLFFRQKR